VHRPAAAGSVAIKQAALIHAAAEQRTGASPRDGVGMVHDEGIGKQ